jgi:hypothetical protein
MATATAPGAPSSAVCKSTDLASVPRPHASDMGDLLRRTNETCERSVAYADNVLEAHAGAFVKFVAFPNLSCAHRAIAPSGGIAVHHADERVIPDFLDEHLHCGISLYRVLGGMETFDHDKAVDLNLSDLILTDETNECKPTLEHREETSTGVQDSATWNAYLDRSSAFVGLYHTTIRATRNPAQQVYVVAVHAGGGGASVGLYDLAESSSEAAETWRSFVQRPEFLYAESIAKRNRNRLAHQFATALGLQLQALQDFGAYDEPPPDAAAAPDAATDEPAEDDGRIEQELYAQLGELGAQGRLDRQQRLAAERGVVICDGLATALLEDPLGEAPDNQFVSNFVDSTLARKPLLATPFSETVYNDVLVSGTSACVCARVKTLSTIGTGHGVAQLLSPAEGINMLHGKDADSSSDAPFGNACRVGALAGAPVTTGRLQATAEIDWDAPTSSCATTDALPFLAWRGRNAQPPVANDKVLWGERCVYRPRDANFVAQEHKLGLKDERGVPLGNTRLDPLFVVCAPTPQRRFLRGVYPFEDSVGD